MNTEEFIKKAREVYGDKYDYSKVEYVNHKTKVTIICPKHGEFQQFPYGHLSGHGCKKCKFDEKRLTTEEFIRRAKEKHGDKYDYSKTIYVDEKTKVKIICPIHGEFEQFPYNHLRGRGCKKCNEITTEEFIRRAKEIHGDKYDYSKTIYVRHDVNVTIICPIHGEFEMSPRGHLSGCGCRECANDDKKLSQEEFIEKAKSVHGDKYDYSKVVYMGYRSKITITCPIHGDFEQDVGGHLIGHGCPKCGLQKISVANSSDRDEFIKKAKEIHGDVYDYSKVEYKGYQSKVIIICPIHGEFEQTPEMHLAGRGCRKCSDEKRRMTIEEFINRSNEIHCNKYDYSKSIYTGYNNNLIITCPIHGDFEQRPHNHLRGAGCPACNQSKLENFIRKHLLENNIPFIYQHSWPWLTYILSMRVDFFLPDLNIAIECQGLQHFEPVDYFGGEEGFEKCIDRDKRKLDLCENHGIKMIYFSNLSTGAEEYQYPYKVYEDVSELFKEELHLEIN